MTFTHIGKDTENKLNVLLHFRRIYFDPLTEHISPANIQGRCVGLSEGERNKVISIFKRHLHTLKTDACEECREEKLRHLEIEMSILVSKLKYK